MTTQTIALLLPVIVVVESFRFTPLQQKDRICSWQPIVPQQPRFTQNIDNGFSFSIFAKATSKKKKNKGSTKAASGNGGGFGIVKEKSTSPNKDFVAFPALEAPVAETLVPSPPELQSEPGELPIEIYDRLDQIYGFPMFNYEQSNEVESDSTVNNQDDEVSMNDLISVSEGPSSAGLGESTTSESSFSDLLQQTSKSNYNDFADLIAASSSRTTTTTTTTATATTKEPVATTKLSSRVAIDEISNLSPFSKFRVLHVDPLVLAIDDFFTEEECDKYVNMCTIPRSKNNNHEAPLEIRSRTVGKDAQAKAQRTSTTWFNHYKAVPELMAKASRLVGLDNIDQWEEPQTVRYRRNEKFTWHLDALSPSESLDELGGQRIATLLVYHTDLTDSEGGATVFRDLGESQERYLKVQPKKGSALLFFPAANGIPNVPFDIRTLHSGEVVAGNATQDKWISQMWLRQSSYSPTGPPGNLHAAAKAAIADYCSTR